MPSGAQRQRRAVSPGAGKELPYGDSRGHRGNQRGRPPHLEAHAHAAHVPDERLHHPSGEGRAKANAYIAGGVEDVGADIFERGLCLPSDNKMTKEQQEQIIKVIRRCFE